MRKPLISLTLCLAAAVTVSAFSFRGRMTHEWTRHDSRSRDYYMREASPKRGAYAGLILALHGGGGRARGFPRTEGQRLEANARAAGYLVVYPNGVEKFWNDGQVGDAVRQERTTYLENVDDVGFLTQLVADLSGRFAIPADKVYVCGISNGGRMTLRLVLEKPEVFRAAGVVCMNLTQDIWDANGAPGKPVPIAFLNGTKDPLIPFEGGVAANGKKVLGEVLSTEESVRLFTEAYECQEVVNESVPDAKDDRTRTTRTRHVACKDGAEVVLEKAVGGGHAWPGGKQYFPQFVIGKVVEDYHGSDSLFDFWSRHGLEREER